VVFFCGAGISYPAGLPGFKGLVDAIYRLVGGQRLAVREALAKALEPKLRRRGATDTHAALLQLARSREGALRLVTTNFDRIFARLTARMRLDVPAYPAPLLPIPKNSRWNGLVYLHGLLPEHPDASALNRLVLTSGVFGLAYLTERWAARFVSELFRNYVVCFVGYSINDPVLRYMMDALAADRLLGEVTPQAYALGDYAPGQESNKTIEWEAKGVVPILYEVPAGSHDHSVLHRTLRTWGETYRDGILGKERIVVGYARTTSSVGCSGRCPMSQACPPKGLPTSIPCRHWIGWRRCRRIATGTAIWRVSACRSMPMWMTSSASAWSAGLRPTLAPRG